MDPRPIPNPDRQGRHKIRTAHIPDRVPHSPLSPFPRNIEEAYIIGYPRTMSSTKPFEGRMLEDHPKKELFLAYLKRLIAAGPFESQPG